MSVLIKGMKMPQSCHECVAGYGGCCYVAPAEADGICPDNGRADFCPLIPIPPHGDLIDRDALAEDGWVLTKQVMRMGGYAIHELPLKNPTIPVIIPAEEGE